MRLPKTHSLRRRKVRLPGGRLSIHYKERRPKQARDPITRELLHGVPNLNQSDIGKIPKSQRRPNRPYGGVLSSSEMRNTILKKREVYGIQLKDHPLEVGRLIIKTAGRDAGKIGVIVELQGNTVIIDGQVRRRKCNITHIETSANKNKIKSNNRNSKQRINSHKNSTKRNKTKTETTKTKFNKKIKRKKRKQIKD